MGIEKRPDVPSGCDAWERWSGRLLVPAEPQRHGGDISRRKGHHDAESFFFSSSLTFWGLAFPPEAFIT